MPPTFRPPTPDVLELLGPGRARGASAASPTPATPPCSACVSLDGDRRLAASTSRSPGSARCGTSRPAPWPGARPGHLPGLRRDRVAGGPADGAAGRARSGPAACSGGSPGPASPTDDGVPAAAEPGAGLIDVVAPEQVPPGWLSVVLRQRATTAGRWCSRTPTTSGCAGWPCSTSSPTTPTARAGTSCGTCRRDVFGVDNGLTFNTEDKLRTVLWGWAGSRIRTSAGAACCATWHGGPRRRPRTAAAGWSALAAAGPARRSSGPPSGPRRCSGAGRFPQPPRGRAGIPWPAF